MGWPMVRRFYWWKVIAIDIVAQRAVKPHGAALLYMHTHSPFVDVHLHRVKIGWLDLGAWATAC